MRYNFKNETRQVIREDGLLIDDDVWEAYKESEQFFDQLIKDGEGKVLKLNGNGTIAILRNKDIMQGVNTFENRTEIFYYNNEEEE